MSGLSGNQINTLTDKLDETKLQSYINTIQEIKNAENTTGSVLFSSIQAEEYASALSDIDAKQAALLLSTQGLTNAQIQQTLAAKGITTEEQYLAMAEAGLLTNKQKLSNVELQSVLTSQLGSEAKAKETLESMKLSVATEGEEAQTVQLTAKKLALAVSNGVLTKEEAELLAMTLGVTVAQKAQAASVIPQWIVRMKAMALATWEQVKATAVWLATSPAGWCLAAGAALIALYKIWEHNNVTLEEARDRYKETASELESVESELADINSQIDELLAKDSLTLTDENDLKRLKEENEELKIRKAILDAQKADDANDLNRKIENKYDKTYNNGTEITFIDENGDHIGLSGEEYLKNRIAYAKQLIGLNRELTDQEKEDLQSIRDYALEQGQAIIDLTDGYEAVTKEEKARKAEWDGILSDIAYLADNEAGTIPDITRRLEEKFSNGVSGDNTDLWAREDRKIAEWIESLSDDDKKIMLTCDIDDASLDNLKRYLAEQKGEPENGSIWDYSETITQLGAIRSNLDVIDDVFAKLHDSSEQIGFNDFSSISEAFKDLEGIDGYIRRLQEAGQDTEAATAVMEDLISAYLDYSGVLDNVTDENAGLIQQTLTECGIDINLTGYISALKHEKELLASVTSALSADTEGEIEDFFSEINASVETKQYLSQLILEKLHMNNVQIDTASDIENIYSLADAAGSSSKVLGELAKAKSIFAEVESGSASGMQFLNNGMYDEAKKLMESIENGTYDFEFTIDRSKFKYSGNSAAQEIADDERKVAEDTLEDIQSGWKDYLDKYLSLYKSELEAGLTDFGTFLNKSRSLLDEFYRDGKISAADYWDSVGSLYEQQLSVYDKALSAVTRRIDREIDGIQDIIDSIEEQNDSLQAQLDDYDRILSVVDSVYQKEIDSLNEQKDLLQDKIDAINDANDSLDLQYRREQALYELKRSQEQRTGKVFNGTEFVYTADQDAVKEAQDSLQDIETEEIIRKLEAEQEQLEASVEILERYRDLWADISDAYNEEINTQLAVSMWGKDYEQLILSNRLSDIDSFKNDYISIQDKINDNQGLIDSYNEKIEYYEALKEQWSSISDAYGQAQENQYATMLLGQNWEAEVLNGRLSTLNDFRNEYVSIQQAIADAAWNSANEQIRAAQEAKKGASGSSGGAGSVGADDNDNTKPPKAETPTKYKVVDESGTTLAGFVGDDAESKASAYRDRLDDAIHDIDKINIVPYASGTAHARKGLNLVGENGAETYIDNAGNVSLVTKPSLIPMAGGETVMNAAETASLLDPDNLIPAGIRTPDDLMTFSVPDGSSIQLSMDEILQRIPNVMPDYLSMVQPVVQLPEYDAIPVHIMDNLTPISIGDIHLHEVQNVDSLANAIIRDLPNKAMQIMHRRR